MWAASSSILRCGDDVKTTFREMTKRAKEKVPTGNNSWGNDSETGEELRV